MSSGKTGDADAEAAAIGMDALVVEAADEGDQIGGVLEGIA